MLIARHNRNFRKAAWLALFGMFLQILLPLVHQPQASAFPLNIRICSSFSRTHGADQSPVQKTPSCPICQTLHLLNTGFVSPPVLMIARMEGDAESLTSFTAVVHDAQAVTAAQPRAPPSLA